MDTIRKLGHGQKLSLTIFSPPLLLHLSSSYPPAILQLSSSHYLIPEKYVPCHGPQSCPTFPVAGVVDVVLIPEIPFELDLLLDYVAKTLDKKGHLVICVAEGAGQDVLGAESIGADASGNPILKDIGTFLRDTFKANLKVQPLRTQYRAVKVIARFLIQGT